MGLHDGCEKVVPMVNFVSQVNMIKSRLKGYGNGWVLSIAGYISFEMSGYAERISLVLLPGDVHRYLNLIMLF